MKTLYEIWSWFRSLGIAFIVAFCISLFVFQPFKVSGHSMDPSLHDKQYLIVNKFPHTFSYLPNYSDIVVIDSRIDRKRTFKDDLMEFPLLQFLTSGSDPIFYVKRVIGKPGDSLKFKDNQVYRNGVALDEAYIKEAMKYSSDQKVVVPDKHIYVMGDNRNNSKDSRSIGFIPLDHVMGKKFP
ncbi:signal peptidase I [Paenibacillus psychroresistens]|uniref:Signal peptidase I n=1 Tax=Paenibacillus psychroresistens TaxID=1778678 RepID=A0A6B8RSN9_9BACL|nr:signal peptidase I [Paenibacillus psychroresistens]QGQ98575.1 signal peptidase I [Paenibacillus psychroresistens]